jgi:alpha-N-arabinofuranosidase
MINDLKAVGTVFDKVLGEADIRSLSTEVAGGFVGCTVGCYASANGSESDTYVKFRSLTYKPL